MYSKDLQEFVTKLMGLAKKYPELRAGVDYYELSREEQIKHWWQRYRFIMENEELRPWITKASHDPMLQQFGWGLPFPG